MRYQLRYSKMASNDLNETHDYIANKLFAPIAADNLIKKIGSNIRLISQSPNPCGYRKVYNYPGPREDIHRTIVKKYVIYFAVDRSNYTIEILKVIHSSRNFIRYN